MRLVECVPNFSEGKDQAIIDQIVSEITDVEGTELLDVDPGADTNRTVVTFVGSPNAVEEAAFRVIKKASELIDMSQHKGAHPRMGATDVCPFVPVTGVTMKDCVEIAKKVGERAGKELGIPIFLYEEAAQHPDRQNLSIVRAGEYEGMSEKLKDPHWKPDFGPAEFNVKSGCTAVGAREFLIAFNVNFNTRDKKLVHDIALNIRERGRLKKDADGKILRDEDGNKLRIEGLFKNCKAVGWYIPEYNMAQLSMNLTNCKITSPHMAFDEICKQAAERGIRVTGSELVGLIPKEAMLEAGRYFLEKQSQSAGVPEQELIRVAIQTMGLNDVAPFDPQKKIIEYRVAEHRPLANMTVLGFADELSIDSPAPGGGSVAALCGSLGAALASMVANLTVPKKDYGQVKERMCEIARKAQDYKDAMMRALDDDTQAFNRVMDAMRMKKKTDEEKALRDKAIQETTRGAIMVPLVVMRNAIPIIDLARETALHGNQASLSDACVGAIAARAASEGAFLNVMINLPGITDEGFVKNVTQEAAMLLQEARGKAAEVDQIAREGLGIEAE
ncbi:glutamate formimidoyltransferase [Acidobacteriota bacterium]